MLRPHRLPLIALTTACGLVSQLSAATIADWSISTDTSGTVAATASDANLASIPQLSSVGFISNNNGDGYGIRDMAQGGDTSDPSDNYFTFTITPDAGFEATYTQLNIGGFFREGAIFSFELYKKTASEGSFSSLGAVAESADAGGTEYLTIDFADFTISESVEFRLVAATSNTSTFNVLAVQNVTGGNALTLSGTIQSAVPEPTTYALILGGLSLGLLAYRRRRAA